jgi:hypothetical protein
MSTTAGYYDETLLLNRIAKASALGMDGRLKAANEPNMGALIAVLDNTIMQFGPLMDSDKEHVLQLVYPHFCGNTAAQYTSDNYCTQTCGEPSTNTKLISVPTPYFECFTLKQNVGRLNEVDNIDLYMTARIGAERNLIELITQYGIAALEGALGTNLYAGKGTVVGDTTTINAAYWNSGMIPELIRTVIMNKFKDWYVIDSGLLWNQMALAKQNAGNANGAGDAAAFNSIASKYYVDFQNMAAVHGSEQVMYLIDKSAIGMAFKTRVPGIDKSRPVQFASDDWRWSEPSMFHPGIVYDVHYTIACDSLTDDKVETYKFIARPVVAVNPTGCDTANTGILKLVCG